MQVEASAEIPHGGFTFFLMTNNYRLQTNGYIIFTSMDTPEGSERFVSDSITF